MANILVVDDNEYFREALKISLVKRNHEVTLAPNGKAACEILLLEKFDVILSDIQMPQMDGVQLLQWTKTNSPVPFILMTGFANVMKTKTAVELGAQEFLSKPFRNEDLHSVVEKLVAPSSDKNSAAHADIDGDYRKVSIDEFVVGLKNDFDVFIRLSCHKYVKIGRSGNGLPEDQIKKYKERGLSFLHIRKEDFSKLVGFNVQLSKVVVGSEVDHQKKLNFMKYTGEVLLEKVFVDGLDKETFKAAQSFLTGTVSVLAESKENMDLLSSLNGHSDYLYARSVGVAMYAVMIARKLGIDSQKTFFNLSMAGLFHDVGLKEIDREIVEKARPALTQTERKIFETHPTRSMEILLMIPNMPSDVVRIAQEHHEDQLGSGYPRALPKDSQHPLTKIIALAALFVETAVKGPNHPGMSGLEAIDAVQRVCGDRIDRVCLDALVSLFANVKVKSTECAV
jgi:putative nucleotidyltransferase with HDIG domain